MPPLLTTDVVRTADATVITAVGEIDMSTCDDLRGAIEPHIGAAQSVVLDFAAVSFLDSSGIRVLVQTRDKAVDCGGEYSIRNPSAAVRRVLTVSGLLALFEVPELDPPTD